MAIGAALKQGQFEDAATVLGDRLALGSLYRLLADEGHWLFPDDYFADLFVATPRGRPTIPARAVATVVLLQSFEGLLDREACDRLAFDLRWQAAAGLSTGAESFHPTVLVGMRNRLRVSERPYRLHEDTLVPARAAGVLKGRARYWTPPLSTTRWPPELQPPLRRLQDPPLDRPRLRAHRQRDRHPGQHAGP